MKKLLLIGGGQAHLHVLKLLEHKPIPNVEIQLISPDSFQYFSEMFSEFIEELRTLENIRVDLEGLCKKAQVKFIKDAAAAIDPEQKKLLTTRGSVLNYDAISFDIGALTSGTELPGVVEHAHRLLPNYHFPEVVNQVRNSLGNVVIVGGGREAVELSLGLKAWRSHQGVSSSVTLVSEGPLLQDTGGKGSKKLQHILNEKGVQILSEDKVIKIERHQLKLSSDKSLPFEQLVWMEGRKAPGFFKTSGLPVDEEGYLMIEDTLQVKKYPSIFGVGNCASLTREREGYREDAVRQGSILYENLGGFFGTGKGLLFKPIKQPAFILSIGNQKGLFFYKRLSVKGPWVWRVRHYLNTQLISRYQKNNKK